MSQRDLTGSRSAAISSAVGILISALFLWLAGRNVEWARLWEQLQVVRLTPLLVGLAAAIGSYVAMAYRWRLALDRTVAVSTADAFDFTTIGFLAGLVMPQRLGDVVKVVLLARRGGVSRTTVLGTVVVERLTDVIMLLLLAGAFVVTVQLPILLEASLAVLAAGTAVALVVLLSHDRLMPLLSAVMRTVLPAGVTAGIEALAAKLFAGAEAIRGGARLSGLLLAAALVWALAGAGMMAYVSAFDLAVPWYAGLLVILLTNLGGILPSSPGAIGVYHYMAVLALTTLGIDRTKAMTFAIATHALTLLVILVTGLWGLTRQGLTLRAVREGAA